MSHQIDADTLASTNYRLPIAGVAGLKEAKSIEAVINGDFVGYEVHVNGRAVAIGLKLADAVAVYNDPPEPIA